MSFAGSTTAVTAEDELRLEQVRGRRWRTTSPSRVSCEHLGRAELRELGHAGEEGRDPRAAASSTASRSAPESAGRARTPSRSPEASRRPVRWPGSASLTTEAAPSGQDHRHPRGRWPRISLRVLPAAQRRGDGDARADARSTSSRSRRRSCRSPTAPAARPASAPTRSSSASTARRRMTAMAHLTCVVHTRAELRRDRRPLPRRRHREHPRPRRRPADGPRPARRASSSTPSSSCGSSASVGDFSIGVAVHPSRTRARRRSRRTGGTRPRSSPRPTSRSRSSSSTPSTTSTSSTTLRDARRRQAGDPGHHAGDQHRQHQADGRDAGLGVPRVAGGEAPRGRGRPRGRVRGRHRGGDEAVPRAPRRRRARAALLHAEPVDRDAEIYANLGLTPGS